MVDNQNDIMSKYKLKQEDIRHENGHQFVEMDKMGFSIKSEVCILCANMKQRAGNSPCRKAAAPVRLRETETTSSLDALLPGYAFGTPIHRDYQEAETVAVGMDSEMQGRGGTFGGGGATESWDTPSASTSDSSGDGGGD